MFSSPFWGAGCVSRPGLGASSPALGLETPPWHHPVPPGCARPPRLRCCCLSRPVDCEPHKGRNWPAFPYPQRLAHASRSLLSLTSRPPSEPISSLSNLRITVLSHQSWSPLPRDSACEQSAVWGWGPAASPDDLAVPAAISLVSALACGDPAPSAAWPLPTFSLLGNFQALTNHSEFHKNQKNVLGRTLAALTHGAFKLKEKGENNQIKRWN